MKLSPKKRHLLLDLQSGKTCPALSAEPLLSSASQPWRGISLEHHADTQVDLVDMAPLNHVMVVQLKSNKAGEWKNGSGRFRSAKVRAGQVCLFPSMAPFSSRGCDTGEFLALELDPTFLSAAHELINPDHFELICRFGIHDPVIRELALALKAELEAGAPGGRVYAESIATTLAVHLVRHHSGEKPIVRKYGHGLGSYYSRRVIEFIQEHLAEDISLTALANVAGMSVYHFARLFKDSTGVAPHRYVILRRIERAKELMLARQHSISEIAAQVGFCDQSHLTLHFKRLYGLTPKAFIQQTVPRPIVD